ncbi:unnamed protein product, partial [Sphacelaria rigidula]
KLEIRSDPTRQKCTILTKITSTAPFFRGKKKVLSHALKCFSALPDDSVEVGIEGKAGTGYWYLGHLIPYGYRSNRVFPTVIPMIPTIPRYLEIPVPTVPAQSGTISWYFDIPVPTVPAQSGIIKTHTYDTMVFRDPVSTVPARTGIIKTHTYDTHACHGMRYPGKNQGYARYGISPTAPVKSSHFLVGFKLSNP